MRSLFVSLFVAVLLVGANVAYADGPPENDPLDSADMISAKKAIEAKDFAAAEKFLKVEIKYAPGNADAWNLLAYSIRKQGRLDEAETFYAKALDVDKDHVGAMSYLGVLYVQTGRIDKAKALLAEIDDACFFSCRAYDELKDAIEAATTDKISGQWLHYLMRLR